MKKTILLFICLLCATFAFAQKMQDVVYLKNGSVIRGTITELKPSESISIQTSDGSIFVYKMDEVERTAAEEAVVQAPVASEKSPALAGILSFLLPGAGQFYYGNNQLGWIDLGEEVAAILLLRIGANLYSNNVAATNQHVSYVNEGLARTGLSMVLAGVIWGSANEICSIVNAVKGARAVNRENGYAMIDVGNGVSVGCRPSLSYEVPEYACHMPGGLSTGLSLRIAF
ncbi:MAG: hypothetical protein J5814_03645 [Bacteroidaceae bacterium]|nr:hypothetical protein [Bacteroidaceae bacterium]